MSGTWPFAVWAWLVVAMSLSALAQSPGPSRDPTREAWRVTVGRWAPLAAIAALVSAVAHFVGSEADAATAFEKRMIDDPIARSLGVVVVALGAASFLRGRTREPQRSATALATIAALVAVGSRDLLVSWVALEVAAFASAHTTSHRSASTRVDRALTLVGAMGVGFMVFATATTQLDAVASAVTSAFTQWGAAQPYVDIVEVAQEGSAQGAGVPAGLLQQARAKAITGLTPVALLLAGSSLLLVAILGRAASWPMTEPGPRDTTDAGFSARALVQVAAWAGLLRVFVSELATARLVASPYGWTQALPVLAVLLAIGAAFVPLQPHGTEGVIAASRRARASVLLLLATGAATMLGNGRLQSRIESGTWATAVSEWTVAAFVAVLAVGLLAELALVLAEDSRREAAASRRGLAVDARSSDVASSTPDPGIFGLAHTHPARAVALGVALLALSGIAPTLGGVVWWMTSLAMAEHSALVWIWPLVLLGQLAALRHVYVALAASTTVPPHEPAWTSSPEPQPFGAGPSGASVGANGLANGLQLALVVLFLLPMIAPGETLRRLQHVGTAFHVNPARDAGKAARERRVAEVDTAREGRILSAPVGGATDAFAAESAAPAPSLSASQPPGSMPSRAPGDELEAATTGEAGTASAARDTSDTNEDPTALGYEDARRAMSIERVPPE